MVSISPEKNVVTTINVFTVAPEHQQQALDLLLGLATQIANSVPGFLSANIHKSSDGSRLVNYAQYSNHEVVQSVEAAIAKIAAEQPAIAELRKLATADFRTYEVVSSIKSTLDIPGKADEMESRRDLEDVVGLP